MLACTNSTAGTCASPQTAAAYSYDARGRVADFWQCTPANCGTSGIWDLHYNYNLAGDVTSYTRPEGFTITNQINPNQQVTQITSSWNDATHPATLATMNYTAWGAPETLTNGCAGTGCTQVQETYDYNNRLQPVRFQLGTSASTAADYCRVYNYYGGVANASSCAIPAQAASGDNGNVMGYFYQDSVNPSLQHTASYTYDNLGRLTAAQATGNSSYSQSYNYTSDASSGQYGNMSCTVGSSGYCPQVTFDRATNRILNIGSATASYDAAGEMTSDGVHTYQWDAEGRLSSVDAGATYSMTYNALGERVEWSKTGGSFVFDAAGTWLGIPGSFSAVKWGGRSGALYISGTTEFFHVDHLGSNAMETDPSGSVIQDMAFYPWGEVWTAPQAGFGYNFASLPEYDGATSTSATLFRQYSMNLGRWLSPDPLGGNVLNPQSLNRYAYVLNNPTNLIDPLGLFPCFSVGENGLCDVEGGDSGGGWLGGGGDATFFVDGFMVSEGFASTVLQSGAGYCVSGCDGLTFGGIGIDIVFGGGGGAGGGSTGGTGIGFPPASGPNGGFDCNFAVCGGALPDQFTSTIGGDDPIFKLTGDALKKALDELRAAIQAAKARGDIRAATRLLKRLKEVTRELSKRAHQGTDIFLMMSVDPRLILPCVAPQTPMEEVLCGKKSGRL